MTTTYKVKAYSRTTSEDDASKMTRYEYNGSFGVHEMDLSLAFASSDKVRQRELFLSWSRMMDCFYDCLFIRVDTDEVITFNEYE